MKKKKPDLEDIEHPHRYCASVIINNIIEPLLKDKRVSLQISSHGLNGELYYQIEDKLTEIINKYANKKN